VPKRLKKTKIRSALLELRGDPEWQQQVDRVTRLRNKGYDLQQIVALTDLPHATARQIMMEEDHTRSLVKQQWDNKIPIMRDVITMGLNGLRETLKELEEPDVRRGMLKSAQDLVALTKVVESLNMLLRLEEGKSTANVATSHTHTFQKTREVLQELSKVDPIFEYNLPIEAPVEPEPIPVEPELVQIEHVKEEPK